VSVRTVDDAQYENRTRAFDFDIIVASWPQSLSPGNEQRGGLGFARGGPAGLAQFRRHQEIRRSTS